MISFKSYKLYTFVDVIYFEEEMQSASLMMFHNIVECCDIADAGMHVSFTFIYDLPGTQVGCSAFKILHAESCAGFQNKHWWQICIGFLWSKGLFFKFQLFTYKALTHLAPKYLAELVPCRPTHLKKIYALHTSVNFQVSKTLYMYYDVVVELYYVLCF